MCCDSNSFGTCTGTSTYQHLKFVWHLGSIEQCDDGNTATDDCDYGLANYGIEIGEIGATRIFGGAEIGGNRCRREIGTTRVLDYSHRQ